MSFGAVRLGGGGSLLYLLSTKSRRSSDVPYLVLPTGIALHSRASKHDVRMISFEREHHESRR